MEVRWVTAPAERRALHDRHIGVHCDPEQPPAPRLVEMLDADRIAAVFDPDAVMFARVHQNGEITWVSFCVPLDQAGEAPVELARFIAGERGGCSGRVANPDVRAAFASPLISETDGWLEWHG